MAVKKETLLSVIILLPFSCYCLEESSVLCAKLPELCLFMTRNFYLCPLCLRFVRSGRLHCTAFHHCPVGTNPQRGSTAWKALACLDSASQGRSLGNRRFPAHCSSGTTEVLCSFTAYRLHQLPGRINILVLMDSQANDIWPKKP